MFRTNVLVLGSNGMLGHDVLAYLQAESQKKSSKIGIVTGIDRSAGLDLTKRHTLGNYLLGKIHYDVCINCIAYTDTAAAQNTVDGYNQSYLLNAMLPKHIAESCKFYKTRLIHISTDYVFSEHSERMFDHDANCPFAAYDEPFPTTVYGQHKLLGEESIKAVFGKDSKEYAILRVSWLFGMHKHKSFVHKFLANAVKAYEAGKTVSMTADEYSVPTSTDFVCECIMQTLSERMHGTFHAVPETEHGVSRLEFANQILYSFSVKLPKKPDFSKFLVPASKQSFHPTFTAMKKSYEFKASAKWENLVERFIEKHGIEIIQDAAKQISKQD